MAKRIIEDYTFPAVHPTAAFVTTILFSHRVRRLRQIVPGIRLRPESSPKASWGQIPWTKECVRYLPRVKMVLAEFRLYFCEGYRDEGDDA
jgi:hypothetical protein